MSRNHQDDNLSVGEQIARSLQEGLAALKSGSDPTKHFRITPFRDLLPESFSGKRVRQTRDLLGTTPTEFALFIGISARTLRSWEKGLTSPSPMACRFLAEIERDPDYWRKRFEHQSKRVKKRLAAKSSR